jgi:Ser/Thr protein kinase RdoA (MazF antagonist)
MALGGLVNLNHSFSLPAAPVAQGRTAEIYVWDSSHILKLYHEWCPEDWAEYEGRVARAIHNAGIPSPAVAGLVEVEGRRGLVYERIEGISMLQDMNARPWRMLNHARSLADLQIRIHRQSIEGLPSYRDRLRFDILHASALREGLREKALAMLDALPGGQSICHGDYHPGNVLLTGNGPIVIDWMTACSGSPWADVARSSLILQVGARAAGRQVHPVIRLFIKLFHRLYLQRYLALASSPRTEVERWMPVIAAARLNENIIPERDALIKMIEEDLETKRTS